ncbi:hypothetical protein KDA_30180 [Dictyobacter alpinus]|uniref:Uncharacterized protein n=1 Tax=Dictyobacter alpinus TaxID=2014873 RepID=A0A402B832_9CHLR|nr:hypothetical protein [Dictyobacter alpinus]GCE27534.1 hypothetical protein KDA_30180 [Dictyobacter alpinus]
MGKDQIDNDEIVYVPIPKRLLPAFYRMWPALMVEDVKQAMPVEGDPNVVNRTLIDLITKVALEIGAEQHVVSLADLHTAYLSAYPGIGKGATRGSFDATINYHCINMRSRFPDSKDKRKPAYWLSHPVFKRVAHARYMLLSSREIELFHRCVESNNPLIYTDEYDVADLAN